LNSGPHRPELWAKPGGVVRSTCKSTGSGLGSRPLRSSVFPVDSRGFDREIDSLPNDEDAGAGSLVISSARCAATARAALHVPNRRVTTLAAGHSPWRGVRARLPHVDARACSASRMTSAAGRSGRASRASREHPFGGPAPLDPPALAGPEVGVGVALARLRVRAAAAAYAHVTGLDRPRLLPGRAVEVRLDCRRRTAETVGDLGDRPTLDLPEVVASATARRRSTTRAVISPEPSGIMLATPSRSAYVPSIQKPPSNPARTLCIRAGPTTQPPRTGSRGTGHERGRI
jgi:hypothetical protein